jgi:hypothetical protein
MILTQLNRLKQAQIPVGGFTTEYQAILDEATTLTYTLPSGANQTIQNQIIVDMKADGLWTTTDAMFYFKGDGGNNFKKINWKNPTGDKALEVGAGALVYASTGIKGDGTNYLDLKWNPTDDGTNYLQNDFSIAFDIVTIQTSNSRLISGKVTGARSLEIYNISTWVYFNSTGTGARSFIDFSTTGFFIADFDTNTTYASKDGAASFDTEGSKTTDSLPNEDLQLFANGSFRGDMEIGSLIIGASLNGSTTNYTNLYNAINGI